MGTYVTVNGFTKKTLAEIKADINTTIQTIFGNDIDLDPDQPFGQISALLAKYCAEAWDALEEIYTARNPNQAYGVSLDNAVAENGIIRLSATATSVDDVILWGDEGTVIAAGKKAKQTDSTINYELENNVTITKTIARIGVIEVTTIAAGTYRVTIDAINYDYIAGGGESKTDILNAIEALITAGSWAGTASVATEQLTLTDLDTDFSFDITGNLDIVERASAGDFTAESTGANPLPANSLIEIVTPVTGWDSVINYSAGTTGTEQETDYELRIRRENSLLTGNATDDAIASKLRDDVDNVSNAIVISNRSDSTDADGRPPHSFEAIVVGGDDTEIAQKIWDVQPSGIPSYGSTSVIIQDSEGVNQTIKFSRPESIYIFVKVKRDLYSEEDYPTDGDDLIKQAIVDWSLIATNIDIGKDVIRQRLNIPVYEISGIEDIEITLDDSDTLPHTPSYSATNIEINGRQIAIFAVDRIVVEDLTP